MSVPPREWFEKNFVHDGKITYCSVCHSIPWSFIGHECTGIEAVLAGYAADKIEVDYCWKEVHPIQNEDRPDDWMLMWVPKNKEKING